MGSWVERPKWFGFITFGLVTRRLASQLVATRKERVGERGRSQPTIHKRTVKATPLISLLPLMGSHLLLFPTFQKCHQVMDPSVYQFISLKQYFPTSAHDPFGKPLPPKVFTRQLTTITKLQL